MTLAFVFVECEEGHTRAVKKETEAIDGVQEVHSIAGGDYDIIVKVDADERDLHGVLAAIRGVGGIAALATSIVCRNLN
jgi:DNA-binding Lrp family transcriptional regulator